MQHTRQGLVLANKTKKLFWKQDGTYKYTHDRGYLTRCFAEALVMLLPVAIICFRLLEEFLDINMPKDIPTHSSQEEVMEMSRMLQVLFFDVVGTAGRIRRHQDCSEGSRSSDEVL